MNPTRWISLHCGEEAKTLLAKHPNAFLLLCQIAMRARWKDCPITKLKVGEAFIGDWKAAGLHSEKAYQVAKKRLATCGLATFQGGNKGTVAKLTTTTIFSLFQSSRGEPEDRLAADRGRTEGEQGATKHTVHKEHPHTLTTSDNRTKKIVNDLGPRGQNFTVMDLNSPLSEEEEGGRELILLVKSLRPAWHGIDQLTSKEKPHFDANRPQLEHFTAEDWAIQKEYFAAALPPGIAAERPEQLWVYLSNPERTRGQALDWKRKQRSPKPSPATPKPLPLSDPKRKQAVEDSAKALAGFLSLARKPPQTQNLSQEAAAS